MGERKLDGSMVMVIGGSSGIGLACAEAARDAGASVVIAGRSPEKLGRAKAQIGADVRTLVADVTDEASVRDLFGRVERVDHLLVAAAETAAVGVVEAEETDVRPTLDIRVWGGFFAAKHAAPAMHGGSITFMSGTSSHRPYPGAAMVAASGGAIEAFARALALELAPIRVNTICAGFVDTPLLDAYYGDERDEAVRELTARLPVGRIGTPEDIADGAMFLMGNGFVTGTVLHIDGGKLLV
ncbi:SDR family oxidoreductase [Rubrobacter tropicus]|uniref:SDR family oxidoreductase n=1 Tax=Rubrobacter tropicus TaxID=2653851 RepID=A0A6G8QDT2_9ACTN|nr:SDR family oxidoreductase [Rubrobacter tropicus]QIN84613.1 SDR family oxidoreductase [Rubrobacter tropicus]